MKNKIYLKRMVAGDAQNEKINGILFKREVHVAAIGRADKPCLYYICRLLIFCKKYGIK
jgi:hypothetical protein